MPPLLADFSHARACKPFCEKYLTLPVSATDFVTTENKTTEFFPIYSLKNPYVLLSLE